MKLIKIIKFKNLKIEDTVKFETWRPARAVVFDDNKNISILGRFIQIRDSSFLKEAEKFLK